MFPRVPIDWIQLPGFLSVQNRFKWPFHPGARGFDTVNVLVKRRRRGAYVRIICFPVTFSLILL
jgi:hypothetical protein